MVNPRLHDGKEVSAEMQFFNNEYSGLGCFYVYWMPVMALVHPEVRDNKFVQHAKPAVYVGPSREVESDGFGLFWNGTRHFTTSLGCVRGDDRAIIAKSSRTNPEVQPFTTNPDSPAPMPSFDSWIDLTFEKPGTETTPSSIDDSAVFHTDLKVGDPAPKEPFYLIVYAGKRRINEVGHCIKRVTKKGARAVSIDTQRRGYNHNLLIKRVFDWVIGLAMLAICLGTLLMLPCGAYAPNRLGDDGGPPALFNSDFPNGIPMRNGELPFGAELALQHGNITIEIGKAVHSHGGKVIIEQPVNHGEKGMWPIKGREKHSTFFDTDIFKKFKEEVPGDFVYCDLCMTGALSRKSTAGSRASVSYNFVLQLDAESWRGLSRRPRVATVPQPLVRGRTPPPFTPQKSEEPTWTKGTRLVARTRQLHAPVGTCEVQSCGSPRRLGQS